MDDLQRYTVLLNPSKLKHMIPQNVVNYTYWNKEVKYSAYYSPNEEHTPSPIHN